jgi:predicted transcriptional regulator
MKNQTDDDGVDGELLLLRLSALANRHRLRIIGILQATGRQYISQLARDVGISRPLLHLHLQKMEAAGLVSSNLELSVDGKALNFFEVTEFAVTLDARAIALALPTLAASDPKTD